MPQAARLGDNHVCPKVEPGPVPHVGGPIFSASSDVIIGHLPAARVRDSLVCVPVGPTDSIKRGSSTVLINARSAARRTDPCAHGGRIVVGCPTVIIGDTPQSFSLRAAAQRGTPFCEDCERKRRQMDDHDDSADPSPSSQNDTVTLGDDNLPQNALSTTDPATGAVLTREQLAAQPNQGDGLDQVRERARLSVAYRFYSAQGAPKILPHQSWSHIQGIDLKQPVDVIDVSGQTLYQRGRPGDWLGEYFSDDPNVSPTKLGISDQAYARVNGQIVPPPVSRDKRMAVFPPKPPALALRSTAAKIKDTWSILGKSVQTQGGGPQLMVPSKFHTAVQSSFIP
jgi:uncharacterized Zn-binding protein involved in type VI secretion